jgi:hypothetical protein
MNDVDTYAIVSCMCSVGVVVMNKNTTVIRVVNIGTGNIIISTNQNEIKEELNTV